MRKFTTLTILILLGNTFNYSQVFDGAFKYGHPERVLFLDSIATYVLKIGINDSAEYFQSVEELKTLAEKKNDKRSLLYADYLVFYFNIVNVRWSQLKIEDEYQKLFDRAEKLEVVTVKINLYLNMGYYYYGKENPDYVLYFDYLNKAYLQYKDLDVKSCIDKSYNLYSMALAYYRFGDYWDAIKYSNIILSLPNTPDYVSLFNSNLLGVSYLKLGLLDSSRIYLKKTLELSTKMESENRFFGWDGIAIGNIGHTWYKQKSYNKAIECYIKGVQLCSEQKLWDNVSPFASHLINCYVIQQRLKDAETIIPIARQSTYTFDHAEGYYYYYDALANYFLAKNDFQKAIMYRDSSILWNDSLQKTFDRNLKVRAELINYQQQATDKQQKLRSEKQREELIKNATFALALILLVIALFVYTRQTRVIRVRTLLLHEIHHRVKNNLQIISSILDIQQRSLNNPELKGVFNDAKSRINSMALVHQNLYEKENLAYTDAQSYFEQLTKIITMSYAPENKHIVHKINAHGIELNLDTLIPVALIFNELLTNSYKYAFTEKDSGEIYFELKKNSDGFVMTFRDNGVGLKEDFDFKKSAGLGSLMIQQLTQQLFGKFNVRSSLHGTEFNFTFKGL
jgi:two-component sensor histidine kinase